MNNDLLFTPLTLPNGAVLPNRLCKAAMEENLSIEGQLPGEQLNTLYSRWAEGGVGLQLTGNVMVAPDALTGPGGVVLQDDRHLDHFKTWAEAGKAGGAHFWMQINHPGRQVYAAMGEQAVGPSNIPVNLPGFEKLLAKPRALSGNEVKSLVGRFATTAALAEKAGFTGVQIHAAHGYLISQFLSPLVNNREDEWGGSLENRARFLLEVLKAIKAVVSPSFCISVKLNSADFQKGGFELNDAKWVALELEKIGLDLLEMSGGSYESPVMTGTTDHTSTSKREAYFVGFAREIAAVVSVPIMVTGGIFSPETALHALTEDKAGFGVKVLGLGRGLAFDPDLPNLWKAQQSTSVQLPKINWSSKTLASLGLMSVSKAQLKRLAAGKPPKPNLSPAFATLSDQLKTRIQTRRYRRWRDGTTS
ncbi:MAG: NADH:flavin oxidoreductase/NADH oxidase family protein [Pseudohongiellaceae bacterium]